MPATSVMHGGPARGWVRRLRGWLWPRVGARDAPAARPRARAAVAASATLDGVIDDLLDPARREAAADPGRPLVDADERMVRVLVPLVGRAVASTEVYQPAVGRLAELLQLDATDFNGTVRAVTREPAIVAAMLATANSPEFRRGPPIADIRVAVATLGLDTVRQLALAVTARALHEPDPLAASAMRRRRGDRELHRAMTAAFATSWLGLQHDRLRSDLGFVAAMFLDVGRALAYRELARLEHAGGCGPVGDPVAERVADLVHARLGEAALASWGLPAVIAGLCGHHHDPALADELDRPEHHAVRAISGLVHVRDGEPATLALRASLAALGLDRYELRNLAGALDELSARASVILGQPDRPAAWPAAAATA